jgi:SHS2 domain-containing protein
MTEPARGHAQLPHTADLIVEAWATTRAGCLEEAVAGLVASFADTSGVAATEPLGVTIEPGDDPDVLVALLQEAIYVVDVFSAVPATCEITETDDGGLAGYFDLAPLSEVTPAGPAPKAISYNELAFARDGDGWRARFTVDV